MGGKPVPKTGFITGLQHVKREGGRRWTDGENFFEWDSLHGEFEMYNKRGKHLGVCDEQTGAIIKPAVEGRTISV